jgi:hypothetical protein
MSELPTEGQNDRAKYELVLAKRRCCHEGCTRTVTHFMVPVGSDPASEPVWCLDHDSDSRRPGARERTVIR